MVLALSKHVVTIGSIFRYKMKAAVFRTGCFWASCIRIRMFWASWIRIPDTKLFVRSGSGSSPSFYQQTKTEEKPTKERTIYPPRWWDEHASWASGWARSPARVSRRRPHRCSSAAPWCSRSAHACTSWRHPAWQKKLTKGSYQCCGSGSGIRCLFDPWIRDG